jgi:hypothetical protein
MGLKLDLLRLREVHTLRVFENRMLRRIFGPKGGRRLHSKELYNLRALPSIISVIISRRMRRAGNVARVEEMRNRYEILVGKPEGKIRFGRRKQGWEDIF